MDYATFLAEILNPKPADAFRITPASRSEMLRPQVRRNAASSWALGWEVNHTSGGDFIRHGGGNPGIRALSGIRRTSIRLRHHDEQRRQRVSRRDRETDCRKHSVTGDRRPASRHSVIGRSLFRERRRSCHGRGGARCVRIDPATTLRGYRLGPIQSPPTGSVNSRRCSDVTGSRLPHGPRRRLAESAVFHGQGKRFHRGRGFHVTRCSVGRDRHAAEAFGQLDVGSPGIGEERDRRVERRHFAVRDVELIPLAVSFARNASRSRTSKPM